MSSGPQAPVLARLTTAHLPQAVELSSEMGWPYRLEDWAFAHQLGEGLALEQSGRLVGTAMRWNYGDRFATMGMIIVARAFQGRGLGAALVDALVTGAGSRTILLNATKEAFELYARRGFESVGTVDQHQGIPVPDGVSRHREQVRTATAADLATLLKLDEAALGLPRPDLLKGLAQCGSLMVIEHGEVVSGYAACREFGRGYVVGPLVAPRLADARTLIEAAIAGLPGKFVRVDTSANSGLGAWLEARGLKRVDSVTAMVRGRPPQGSSGIRAFALCSQSLG